MTLFVDPTIKEGVDKLLCFQALAEAQIPTIHTVPSLSSFWIR